MSRVHRIYVIFLILDFFWLLIMMERVDLLKTSVDKKEIEFQINDYFEYLKELEYRNKGMKKYWKVPQLKKQATYICGLKQAQLFTLCQWIANTETYMKSKFQLTKIKEFQHLCYPRHLTLGNEHENPVLEMVTCPYIKNRYLPELEDNDLSALPGTLFLAGSVGANSATVFISRRRDNQIIYEPYGHVTNIDLKTLKKSKNFDKEAHVGIDLSALANQVDNSRVEDSEEFERPLYFKDLLGL